MSYSIVSANADKRYKRRQRRHCSTDNGTIWNSPKESVIKRYVLLVGNKVWKVPFLLTSVHPPPARHGQAPHANEITIAPKRAKVIANGIG